MKKMKVLFWACLLSGLIIIVIGLYFDLMAGLPYQDPTIEMTIYWNANMLAGEYCIKAGGITFVIGVIGSNICGVLLHKRK
ncbi:MAG: hypothetical protein K2M46_14350 [Lachnospiraceae bacterium]|nr:hypothetical protein [Lachnospiraceae bacterium]